MMKDDVKRFGIAMGLALILPACSPSSGQTSVATSTNASVVVRPTVAQRTTPTSASTKTTTTTTTTTTIAAEPTAPTSTTPEVMIPDGVPSQEEIIGIVQQFTTRAASLYADPSSGDIYTFCLANSGCSRTFNTQISNLRAMNGHVEGAEPVAVDHLRAVAALEDGAFAVSFWSEPVISGTIVTPTERISITSPAGGTGITILFVPFEGDSEFPWRATDYSEDPG